MALVRELESGVADFEGTALERDEVDAADDDVAAGRFGIYNLPGRTSPVRANVVSETVVDNKWETVTYEEGDLRREREAKHSGWHALNVRIRQTFLSTDGEVLLEMERRFQLVFDPDKKLVFEAHKTIPSIINGAGRTSEYDFAVKETQRYLYPSSMNAIPSPVYLTWHREKREANQNFAEDQMWSLVQEFGTEILSELVGESVPVPIDVKGIIEAIDSFLNGDTAIEEAKADDAALFRTVSIFHTLDWFAYYPSNDNPSRIRISATESPLSDSKFTKEKSFTVFEASDLQIVDAPCWMDTKSLYEVKAIVGQ